MTVQIKLKFKTGANPKIVIPVRRWHCQNMHCNVFRIKIFFLYFINALAVVVVNSEVVGLAPTLLSFSYLLKPLRESNPGRPLFT
jgi:hypothetical protein